MLVFRLRVLNFASKKKMRCFGVCEEIRREPGCLRSKGEYVEGASMTDQDLNINCEATARKRPESLQIVAGNDLDREILSYSQRHDLQTGLLNHQAFQDADRKSTRLNSSHLG